VAHAKPRSQRDVVDRCRELADEVRSGLGRASESPDDPAVVDAVWRGEALGALLWALALVDDVPPYDEPFDHDALVGVGLEDARLREVEELEEELASAQLWHWRARTTFLQQNGAVALPERWESFDQLVAATAMRGFEQGLLPAPMRGDFRAYGKVYRHLSPEQHAEALSIALERHHALAWACGLGKSWDDVPLDT
jgi:hypothetical protein